MADVRFAGGEVPGHLATPTGSGPWPGVVVIHEAFGLNDDTKRIADRFAEHGYLALAPDFFAGGGGRLAGPSAEDAWRRILAFFGTHLRGPAAAPQPD